MTDTDEPQTDEVKREEVAADPEITTRRIKHLESIETLNGKARIAKADWLEKKEVAKDAKQLHESLMEQVSNLITGGPHTPLFDNADAGEGFGEWQDIKLGDLADPLLSDSILVKLAENTPPLTTLGQLADWQADKGDFWAKDLAGIGEKAREEIELFQEAHLPSGDGADAEEAAKADAPE